MNTRYTIEMLERGFLGFRQFKPALAHTSAEIEGYRQAVDEIFPIIAAEQDGDLLSTPVAHAGLYRLTAE